MLKHPEKNIYIYRIPTIHGDVFLSFKQASAQETRDYTDMVTAVTLDESLLPEIISYWSIFFENSFNRVENKRYAPIWYVKRMAKHAFIYQLFEDIQFKVHKPYKSVYEWHKIPSMTFKDGKETKKQRMWILTRLEKNISDYTWTPVYRIYLEYTLEQIGFYQDCLTWDSMEMFDEWKMLNDKIKVEQWMWLTTEQQQQLEYIKRHSTFKSIKHGIWGKDKS